MQTDENQPIARIIIYADKKIDIHMKNGLKIEVPAAGIDFLSSLKDALATRRASPPTSKSDSIRSILAPLPNNAARSPALHSDDYECKHIENTDQANSYAGQPANHERPETAKSRSPFGSADISTSYHRGCDHPLENR